MASARRILIVEDEALIAAATCVSLNEIGYETLPVAKTGERALELVSADHPDLVLMDIKLQGTRDGIDTAQEIIDRFHVPIVYVTSHSDNATMARAKMTGPAGILLKPVEQWQLEEMINAVLKEKNGN